MNLLITISEFVQVLFRSRNNRSKLTSANEVDRVLVGKPGKGEECDEDELVCVVEIGYCRW